MRIELKEFIERVLEDLIRKEDDLGLPIQSTWERIYYEFEEFMDEIEESYHIGDGLEEIVGGVHTTIEINEYIMECFDDVLEKYEMEKEIFEMKY
jgi:2-iminoacetate synthase ThiH